MPVNCGFCQKNYSEKVARCPFCNTLGAHAPPPVLPAPSLTPAAAAAAQDPELKKRMLLAAIETGRQMRSEPPGEFSHTPGFSLQNIPVGTKAAIVMWVMAGLNLLIGLILIAVPSRDMGNDAFALKIMGVAGLITGLILGGLGFGAFRGMLICIWIGAGLYFIDFIYMITHGAVPGALIKIMVLVALIKFGLQMKEEQE